MIYINHFNNKYFIFLYLFKGILPKYSLLNVILFIYLFINLYFYYKLFYIIYYYIYIFLFPFNLSYNNFSHKKLYIYYL